MIDLRWHITHFSPYKTPIKVLQYRRMENLFELGLQEPIWSAWFDVPTEFEVNPTKGVTK